MVKYNFSKVNLNKGDQDRAITYLNLATTQFARLFGIIFTTYHVVKDSELISLYLQGGESSLKIIFVTKTSRRENISRLQLAYKGFFKKLSKVRSKKKDSLNTNDPKIKKIVGKSKTISRIFGMELTRIVVTADNEVLLSTDNKNFILIISL